MRPGTVVRPGSGRFGRTLSVLVPIFVVLLLAGLVVPAASSRPSSGAVAGFLPSGTRVDGADTDAEVVWQSSQRLVAALAGFNDLSGPVQDALGYGDDLAAPELHGQWVEVDLQPPDAPGELQTLSFSVEPDRITLQAVETPTTWTAFVPGLPVLDLSGVSGRPGRWTGTRVAAASGVDPVRGQATAITNTAPVPGTPDCLATTIALTYDDQTTADRVSRWCRGAGAGWAGDLVGGRGVLRAERRVDTVDPSSLSATTSGPPATGGAVLPAAFYRPVGGDYHELQRFGPSWLGTAGHVLVTARYNGRIEAWSPTPSSPAGAAHRYLRWRVQPDGLVLSLTTIGSLTVAADASDHVTAWSDDGWQRWRVETADVVTSVLPLVNAVVVGDASGAVHVLDAATGVERWSRRWGVPLTVAALAGHVAVVADDTLMVLDATTGRALWQRTLTGLDGRRPQLALTAGVVVVKIDGWLIGRDARTGAVVWWRRTDRVSVTVVATAEQVVVVGAAATEAIGPDGSLRWTAAPALATRQAGPLTALTFADRVELWDTRTRVGAWRYPDGYGSPDQSLVITEQGLTLYQPGTDGGAWWDYR